MNAFAPLLLAVAATALPAPPPARPADGPAWTARYRVSFADAERVEVEAVLSWNRGRGSWPDDVELAMSGGYPDGYRAFVRGFEAFVPDGAKEPRGGYAASEPADPEAPIRVPVLADGRVAFRYAVVLEHDPDNGIGWDETPHRFADGTLWTGRALFVVEESSAVEIEFTLPPGEHLSTSLEPLDRPNAFRAPSGAELRETYLLVGRHDERTLAFDGTTFLLAIDADAAAAGDLIEAQLRSFVETAIRTIGGPPPERCLVAITQADHEGGGSVYGHDAHVLVPGPPSADGDTQWRRTLCHETFHLWNPQKVGFNSREMWFSEGFTDYYAHLLLARAGDLSGRDFLEHVREWASAYAGEAGSVGLREAGKLGAKNRTLIYQGGALAALCIDVTLRAESKNKRSLDDVMAALYELCDEAGERVSIDELERLLDKLGGRKLRGFLARHVEGPEPLALAETLARCGLEYDRRSVAIPEMDAMSRLFQCPGMTVVPGGIEINRTNAGKLKSGDIVFEVSERPVTDFGDLRRALADREPGDRVPVVMLRDGRRVEVESRLGGHGEELARTESLEVTLRPLPKAKKTARAVREALFGDP